MVEHRRTPTRRAYIVPGWMLIALGVVVVLGAGVLAWQWVDRSEEKTASPEPTAIVLSPTTTAPSPTPSATLTPSPTPSATATPTSDGVDRTSIAVSVLNASQTQGIAAAAADIVTARGWAVGAIGNWNGWLAGNTVFYPAGNETEARQLADDLGIDAVAPSQGGMSTQRLSVVLLSAL